MKINANYTWLKCDECGNINKILPGQTFETPEEWLEMLKCECVEKPKPTRKKVVKDAT